MYLSYHILSLVSTGSKSVKYEREIDFEPFPYMTVSTKLYITIDHFNKTITIDDCIFEEPYEQELRQYL